MAEALAVGRRFVAVELQQRRAHPVDHPLDLDRRRVRAFAEDRNDKSQRFYRFINEVPTLLMIVIVVLVVVKPF